MTRPLEVPPGYEALSEDKVPGFLAALPEVAVRLGGGPGDWIVREVGDGNLNFVYLVEGPSGGVCVKQALPYLRLVGEAWPLGLRRAWFEQRAMTLVAPHVGRAIPELYHYDERRFAIVMERLSPHIILRRGLVAGTTYPRFPGQIAAYLAESLFHTSDLALDARSKKAMVADFCANWELCGLSEAVIFTEPYMEHPNNRWTSPQLDATATAVRADAAWKLAAARLKLKFMSSPEALIHGDLHTGSIMVTAEDTRVIDPEFAFVGPMGFDLGAVLGNLWLNALAQDGHARADDDRSAIRAWVLEAAEAVWTGFRKRFLDLWRTQARGDAYPAGHFADTDGATALERERQAYMDRLFRDALGFAGAKITRRILGIAHNIDLELIADPDRRALMETRCLVLARRLMVETDRFRSPADVTRAVEDIRAGVTRIGL